MTTCVVSALLAVALLGVPSQEWSPVMSKDFDAAVLVEVTAIEDRFIPTEIGMLPGLLLQCQLLETLAGEVGVGVGESMAVFRLEDMPNGRHIESDIAISGGVVRGRRHLMLLGRASPGRDEVIAGAGTPWMAVDGAVWIVRGTKGQEFVYHWESRTPIDRVLASIDHRANDFSFRDRDPRDRVEAARALLGKPGLDVPEDVIAGLAEVLALSDEQLRARLASAFLTAEDADLFEVRYETISFLETFGLQPSSRPTVVSALAEVLPSTHPKIAVAAALALAGLGDDRGRGVLEKAYARDSDEDLSEAPGTLGSLPGRFAFDDRIVTATAYGLATIGDHRGLRHRDLDVVLAAAEALLDDPPSSLRALLLERVKPLDVQAAETRKKGSLGLPREIGDLVLRVPQHWVSVHSLLARLGSDESLRKLFDTWVEDNATYPAEGLSELFPRPVVMSHMPGELPPLLAAIRDASPDRAGVFARLAALYGELPVWKDARVMSLRADLGDEEALVRERELQEDAKRSRRRAVEEGLKSPDLEKRSEALASAGVLQIEELFDDVLAAALRTRGKEQRAAIYGLGRYARQLSEEDRVELCRAARSDALNWLSALDLATCTKPELFVEEAIGAAKSLLLAARETREADPRFYEFEVARSIALGVLIRLTRAELPAPLVELLHDDDRQMARMVVHALVYAGNPAAVPHLEVLSRSDDAELARLAARAIQRIGPDR